MRNTLFASLTCLAALAALLAVNCASSSEPAAPAIRRIAADGAATTATPAVIVEDVALVHTTQLLAVDDAGKVFAPDDAAAQIERVWERLRSTLRDAGSDLDRVAKLNWYVSREEIAEIVRRKLADKLAAEQRPAISLVVTELPLKDALVAVDGVAAAGVDSAGSGVRRMASAAIMPPGSRIYVSGQAEPGTLREATRKTLESLAATLKHCGRGNQDIVQLKCFLQPMASVADVREEIAKFFAVNQMPPVSFVEWRSNLPIEIELVAWGGLAKAEAKERLEFLTPPAMKASPLFSRVVRVNRGGTIFFGDLYSATGGSADEQAKEPFDALKRLLDKSGSDFQHLVKATYYVTDDEASRAHNGIRPKYYDPARPPAASKALVTGTGRPGVRYVMDMIAVPHTK
jgi:enamine deaminase RidA (YjgF/YER057c/UK114 family)